VGKRRRRRRKYEKKFTYERKVNITKQKMRRKIRKRRERGETLYSLLLDVSKERTASIKFEVSPVSNQQAEVERGMVRYLLAACLLGLHFHPEDRGNVPRRIMSLKVAFYIVTAMRSSNITRKKKQELLGRTNRLLFFDTTRTP
jgi:hypothetical protein